MEKTILCWGSVIILLAACSSPPDLSSVKLEQSKSVKRYDLVQSLAANDKVLVAGTQNGAVLTSSDQGKSWKRQFIADPSSMTSLLHLAVCPDQSFIGIDYYHKLWSGDAHGAGWKASAIDKPRVPLAVACDSKGRWWVAGSGAKIAVSADKGTHWTVTDFNADAQFTTIQFVDDNFGIALGEFGMVVTTRDGGATWQKTATIAGEFYPYAAIFVNNREGWASGLAGQILHTTDGGKTWVKDPWDADGNVAGAALYQLFLHDGKPTGVGNGGLVAYYDRNVWKPIAYPDAIPVFIGTGASISKKSIAVGGPGGLVRVIDSHLN